MKSSHWFVRLAATRKVTICFLNLGFLFVSTWGQTIPEPEGKASDQYIAEQVLAILGQSIRNQDIQLLTYVLSGRTAERLPNRFSQLFGRINRTGRLSSASVRSTSDFSLSLMSHHRVGDTLIVLFRSSWESDSSKSPRWSGSGSVKICQDRQGVRLVDSKDLEQALLSVSDSSALPNNGSAVANVAA